jgi:hypothetical protein
MYICEKSRRKGGGSVPVYRVEGKKEDLFCTSEQSA